jgi:AcrR family transcriptional regulator
MAKQKLSQVMDKVPAETGEFKTNKKYRNIIETAKALFFKHGIRRVTIEEICIQANASKMTFYKFFANKNDLLRHLLENIFTENIKTYSQIMAEKISFFEKIKKLVILKLEKSDEYGENFIRDLLEDKSGLLEYVTKIKFESDQAIAVFLQKGQEEGVFRKSLTPEVLVYYQNILTEIYKSEQFKALIPNSHNRLEEVMNLLFYGLGEPDLSHEVEVINDIFVL